MRKGEIGYIAMQLHVNGQLAIKVKIYRDGTLIRIGAGGLPSMAVGAVSYWPDNGAFDILLEKLPPALLARDIDYAEKEVVNPLVYELEMGGSSLNGMVGEQAKWANHRLIRFHLDLSTSFRSPILALIDSLTKDAIGLTNSWYFDALVLGIFDMRSNRLPRQTMIAKPDSDSDLKAELANFLSQTLNSPRKWNFMAFPEGKTYSNEAGERQFLKFTITDGQFNYAWVPVGG